MANEMLEILDGFSSHEFWCKGPFIISTGGGPVAIPAKHLTKTHDPPFVETKKVMSPFGII